MSAIGFNKQPSQPDAPAPSSEKRYLIKFDSGRGISEESGERHVLNFGTSGTGKTESSMLPLLRGHLEAGHRGIIFDIKGNFGNRGRGLARLAQREEDIIEYGTEPSSMPINILAEMDTPRFYAFCVDLIENNCSSKSNNMDFHVRGAGFARDCFTLMTYLHRALPDRQEFVPQLQIILDMLQNPVEATRLFESYVKLFGCNGDEEERKFIAGVRNSQFHVLSQTEAKTKRAGNTHYEQLAYNTGAIINTLHEFLDVPGIGANFCAHGAPGADIAKHVRNGKILLIRFSLDCGPVGARLSRLLLNTFYAAIYDLGLKDEKHSFVCIDEFQEVADLSDARFSDTNFIAMAREFRTCFMAASQSASSLRNRGESDAAVDSFISNANNKIFFFTDDPFTRSIAARYDPNVELVDLKPGEAFTVSYNADTREHHWGVETLNNAYASTKAIAPVAGTPFQGGPKKAPGLLSLVELIEEIEKERDMSKTGNEARAEARIETPEPLPAWIVEEYAELFTANACVRVPSGWRPYTLGALELFRDMGMGVKIEFLRIDDNMTLAASSKSDSRTELRLLNKMLSETRHICMNCGSRIEECQNITDSDESDDDEDSYSYRRSFRTPMPICESCTKKYNVVTPND